MKSAILLLSLLAFNTFVPSQGEILFCSSSDCRTYEEFSPDPSCNTCAFSIESWLERVTNADDLGVLVTSPANVELRMITLRVTSFSGRVVYKVTQQVKHPASSEYIFTWDKTTMRGLSRYLIRENQLTITVGTNKPDKGMRVHLVAIKKRLNEDRG